ncbi:MAG: exo-alpha-sialidase, partial [Thermoplasmata archaeon]|nr:exo-alpha-sialidase [Thermoplasmata archaeon]
MSKYDKTLVVGLIVIFLFSGIPAGNLASPVLEDEITAGEGTFRIAVQDDTWSTNPLGLFDLCTWNPSDYIYDSPIRQNFTTKDLIPYIAVGSANQSGDLSTINWDDCTVGNFGYNDMAEWAAPTKPEVIIFYDFENVTWQNGTQMTIRDILFSYGVAAQVPKWNGSVNCLKDNGGIGGNYSSDHWLHIYKVWESGNQAALKFILQEPFYYFFENTLAVTLLPYHIWGDTVANQPLDDMAIWCDPGYVPGNANAWDIADAMVWDNPIPIGSGLFEFDTWNHGVSLLLNTWRDHFYDENYSYSSEGKQPGIDAMIFKIYKTAEQAVLALRNNDIDYIHMNIPTPFVQEVANEPGLSIQMSPSPGFAYLGYNMGKESFGYDTAATFPYAPGDDLGEPFRRAVAHCIDKETIARQLLQNYGGMAANGPISPISSWYNDTIPIYPFDPYEAKVILANAGYELEDGSTGNDAIINAGPGNWWLNPGGTPIGSQAGGLIHILSPPADFDPILAQTGLMIAAQLQDIGINAQSIAMDFGSTINRLETRDFEMYLLDMGINSEPPEFFYNMFHSNMAEDGINYFGYMNHSNDAFIDQARSSVDGSDVLQGIKDAQGSIAYDIPFSPIYHRTIIEAYRSSNFVGWEVDEHGTLFNMETIINLRKPGDKWIEAEFVAPPSAMESNATADITVLTKDQDLDPKSGVLVSLNSTSGTFAANPGTTSGAGTWIVVFTAPYVSPTPQNILNGVTIIVEIESATCPGYDPATPKLLPITVYPEGQDFLSVSIVADPDSIYDVNVGGSLGTTKFTVTVIDQDATPVSGALVIPASSPPGPDIFPANDVTNAGGQVAFIFTPGDLPNDNDAVYTYAVSVLVNKTGYANETDDVNIYVTDRDKVMTPDLEISSVSAINVKDTSATVRWLTNGPADSILNYSTNSDLSSNTSINDLVNITTNHVITLTGLTPGTTYYFEVASRDFGAVATDNNGSNYFKFTTLMDEVVPEEGEWSDPTYISRDGFLWADTYGNDVMGYSPWDNAVFSSDLGDSWGQPYDFDGRVDLQDGVIYRTNMSGKALLFTKSTDNGGTWSSPVTIFQLDGNNDGAYGIFMYESTLFAYSHDQWIDYSIKVSKSLDFGLTWSAPIIVDSGLLTIDPLANDIVYANGKLYMSYFDMTGAATISDCKVVVIESSDMGDTWNNRQVIDTGGFYPVIKADNNSLYVSYITALESLEYLEIEFTKSHNGIDWSDPVKVGYIEDSTDLVIFHSLAVDSGRVFVGYTDYHDLTDDKYYVRIKQSMDGGDTWQDMGDVTGLDTNAMYPCL